MRILPRMHCWQKVNDWKGLDEWLWKYLPIVAPWILVPASFWVFTAFVHACAKNSVRDVILFVAIPVAVWMGFARVCSARLHAPTFAPSCVAALFATMVATHFLELSSATGGLYDGVFALACIALGASFWRMIMSDPGRVVPVPNSYVGLSTQQLHNSKDNLHAVEGADSQRLSDSFVNVFNDCEQLEQSCNSCNIRKPPRAKHCKYCKVCIKRFDHHCPAICNCVGSKNHVAFLILLVAFITAELLYVNSCKIYLQGNYRFDMPHAIEVGIETGFETGDFFSELKWIWEKPIAVLSGNPWVLSTATFSGIQTLWQIPLLAFHVYCACCNLTTDEMFHWEKYKGFYVDTLPAPGFGRPFVGKEFVNPYNVGVKQNLKIFFGI